MGVMLHEQVIVVTGAARGIGRSIADACARAGATVVLVDRLADELAEAARKLQTHGLRVDPRPCELTDEAAVRRLFAGIAADHGRIDGLVNNAGTSSTAARWTPRGPIWPRFCASTSHRPCCAPSKRPSACSRPAAAASSTWPRLLRRPR
jgi:NAD(P)-dependent dehydrogenase (short-subunit alcohol dehydrogenase family)